MESPLVLEITIVDLIMVNERKWREKDRGSLLGSNQAKSRTAHNVHTRSAKYMIMLVLVHVFENTLSYNKNVRNYKLEMESNRFRKNQEVLRRVVVWLIDR